MTSKSFENITVIREISATKLIFKCVCGAEKAVYKKQFERGAYQSCGCLKNKITSKRLKVHGKRHTPEYEAWLNMRRRCQKQYSHAKDYHDRGISVCEQWGSSFETFLKDMGERPSPKHSLDRIDNNGIYEPKNCRWANKSTQVFNQRDEAISLSNTRGVYWEKSINKWRVRIGVNKKHLISKFFIEKDDAISFRKHFKENFSHLYGDEVNKEMLNDCIAELNAFYQEIEEKRAA
jgi:hypothetical protein